MEETAEAELAALAQRSERNKWLRALVDANELKGDMRQLGVEAARLLGEGTTRELEAFEALLVKQLNELGDDPSAAPLAGMLTAVLMLPSPASFHIWA